MSTPNASLVVSDIPELHVPLLPPITDDDLRRKVFTHVTYIGAPTTRVSFLEKGTVAGDYEKLEHVGDAILQSSVTRLLHDMFPHMNHGSATIIRSQLLKNETLAQISDKYGLSDRLAAHPAQAVMLRRNGSIKAALFEAYIAGVHYSTSAADSTPSSAPMAPTTGVSHSSNLEFASRTESDVASSVDEWLRPQFEPLARWTAVELQAQIDGATNDSDAHASSLSPEALKGAKNVLDQYCESRRAVFRRQRVVYTNDRLPSTPDHAALFIATCRFYSDNEVIHVTSAKEPSKKAAANKVAYEMCVLLGVL